MSTSTLFRLVALAAVVLVVAVAVCAFDDDGSRNDLCTMSLATVAGILMVWFLAVVGRPGLGIPLTYQLLLADLLAPPPKA